MPNPQVRLTLCLVTIAFLHARSVKAEDLTAPGESLELVSDEFELADGPSWTGSALIIPDVKAEIIYAWRPKSKQKSVRNPKAGRISASYFNRGQLFLSDNGLSRISRVAGDERTVLAQRPENAKPPERPNDLVVDAVGGCYFTLTRQNQVAYVSPDGQQKTVVDGLTTPNGIILSPDEATLYVAAYRPKEIWAYPVSESGSVGAGQKFAEMDSSPELGADGMTIDRAGNVYCAGPKHIWIWNPRGELIQKLAIPTRPINCVFGDQDLRTLYVTGFGGLYKQRMRIGGKPAEPSILATPADSEVPETRIPDSVTARLNLVYTTIGSRKLLLDVFSPSDQSTALPAIVVVHGGGWLNGDKNKFRALAVGLARRGFVTAAIEYRLGGEARFPAAIGDCNTAVRFLRANAQRFQIDADRIAAVGGSAGGHLVGLMATASDVADLRGTDAYREFSARLQAAVVMAGPFQLTTGSVAEKSRKQLNSNANQWIGSTVDEAPDLYRLASPFQHLSASTPPVLFLTGERDNPERNEPSRAKLTELGVANAVKVYPDARHGCWNRQPWFGDFIADIENFLRKQLSRPLRRDG